MYDDLLQNLTKVGKVISYLKNLKLNKAHKGNYLKLRITNVMNIKIKITDQYHQKY